MDFDLAVPDHTTLARRRRTVSVNLNAPRRTGPVDLVLDSTGLKFCGPDEWDRLKHGEKRRAWRKLPIAVDASTGETLAHVLTDRDTSDAAMAYPLVASAGGRIRTVIAPLSVCKANACRAVDGAYDGAPVYDAIRRARPPRSRPAGGWPGRRTTDEGCVPMPRPLSSGSSTPAGTGSQQEHSVHSAGKGRSGSRPKSRP